MRYSEMQLAGELFKTAQIDDSVTGLQRLPTGQTNETWKVGTNKNQHFILRIYSGSVEDDDMDRMEKEVYLHDLLKDKGVPVPAILGCFLEGDQRAVLMEFVAGDLLGDVGRDLPGMDSETAWATSGEALRKAHEVRFADETHGVVVGRQVRREYDSFGDWQTKNILYHARVLKDDHEVPIDLKKLEKCLQDALPYLNERQGVLLHNDPHPWNILVDEAQGWRCSAWLDWEYAFVGDPTWDLVRMDIWRMWPLETPRAFWDGYGEPAREPNRSIYEMSLYLWQASEELKNPTNGPRHTRKKALEYLKTFDQSLDWIQSVMV